jgi:hypothetical protein
MYTDEAEAGLTTSVRVVLIEGLDFLPRTGVVSSVLAPVDERDNPGMTDGSSNCPAGVKSRPPSGLNVSRRKKLVKLSSPYSCTEAHAAAADGRVRMAGRAGIGEGDRPYLLYWDGELGALEPLKDDRLEEGLSRGGGGNIDVDGVLATEVAGVNGAAMLLLLVPGAEDKTSSLSLCCSLTPVTTDSDSLVVDSWRKGLGRLVLGVRL